MTVSTSRLLMVAGLLVAGAANAELRLQPNGVGDAIYIPYYTVQDGQVSLLTISNGGDTPTAVKLLVAEALNGQNVLSFGVYLPPRSTWSAGLTQSGDGMKLTSQSDVCTVPTIQSFTAVNFDYRSDGNHPDGGGDSLARTQTGSIEIIELGELAGGMATDTIDRDCAGLQRAYTTVNGNPPDRTGQILAPTSRLAASLQIITVQDGIIFPIPAYAISGFSTIAQDPATPGLTLPRLHTPQLAPMETSYRVVTPGGELEFAADRGVDAISALFMTSELAGEFFVAPGLGSSTSWALGFPTKFAYVHERPGSLATVGNAVAPFESYFDNGQSCDRVDVADFQLNGDGRVAAGPGVAGAEIDLCQQVNIVNPADDADVDFSRLIGLSSAATRQIQALDGSGNAVIISGMPAVGVQISNFVNGQLQGGVLANYSIGRELRSRPSEIAIEL